MSRLLAVAGAALLLMLSACGKDAGASPTPSGSATASEPSRSASASAGATASPSSGPGGSASAAPAPPPLGQAVGAFSGRGVKGIGEVKPAEISNGGDGSGDVSGITWGSWSGAQATGHGMAAYRAPGQPAAAATQEPATVVAFDLGSCGGTYMYRSLEWYFPQHGQSFDPHNYEDVCAGTNVGSGVASSTASAI